MADKDCTVVAPCFTTTLTDAESPAALPAVPVNVGEALLDVLASAGAVTATAAGAVVSTVNVTAELVPTLVAASVCDAVTV